MDFDFSPVTSIDQVPEQFRPIYSQTPGEDGKFVIDKTYMGVAEALNGFNKSNKALRNELKTKGLDLTPLKDFGDNPQSILEGFQAKLGELQGIIDKKGDVAKQIDGVKQAMAQQHAKELTARDTRNQALQTQLYSLMVENNAVAAIAELKGVHELLMPFIKNQVKVAEKDGQFIVQVVDDSGEVRYGPTGSPMTIKELVVEMKGNAKFGRLFESEQQGGGGGMRPGGGGTPPRQNSQQTMSSQDKIKAGLMKGQHKRT